MIKNQYRSFIKDLKKIKANSNSLKSFVAEKYLDKNNVAHIHISLKKNDVFNTLSNPKDREISDEALSFIERQAHFIPYVYPIEIDVHTNDVDDKVEIEKKIQEYFWMMLADKNDDLKNNAIISSILFAVGTLLLGIFFILQYAVNGASLFKEIFSIAGTFSIWEAVDYYFINRSAIKLDKLNYAQLAIAKVKIIRE